MNKSKTILVSASVEVAVAVALVWVLIVAPLAISEDAAYAEAKKSNDAKQLISQSPKSSQNSQLGSAGGISFFSESNFNLQTQFNFGNNALAQSND